MRKVAKGIKIKSRFSTGTFDFVLEQDGKRSRIELRTQDGEPQCVLTNIFPELEKGEVAVKDYSENEGMYEAALRAGIIEPAHRYINSGFVTFPVCYIKMDKFS